MAVMRGRVRQLTLFVAFVTIICLYIAFSFVYSMRAERTASFSPTELPTGMLAVDAQARVKDVIISDDGSLDVVVSLKLPYILAQLAGRMPQSSKLTALSNPTPSKRPMLVKRPVVVEPAKPQPVDFLMLPGDVCANNPNLRWIIYVHSTTPNYERRQNIRATWASGKLFRKSITRLVFMTGRTKDAAAQLLLQEEEEAYHDIVQGDFVDDYRNLTLKAVMSLKWVSTHCANAEFAIKADDDAFVNVFSLMQIVEMNKEKRMVACPLWKNNTMPILRNPKTCMKWCLKETDFPGKKYFPQYCAGLAFVLSREIIPEMYEQALQTPYFWVDDVFITGLVLPKLKPVKFVDLLPRFCLKEKIVVDQYMNPKTPLRCILGHIHNMVNFKAIWKALLQRTASTNRTLLADDVLQSLQSNL